MISLVHRNQDRVSHSLNYLWHKFGISNWADNSFQLVDPATYIALVNDLLDRSARPIAMARRSSERWWR